MVLIKEGAYLSEYGYIPEIKMKKILFTVMWKIYTHNKKCNIEELPQTNIFYFNNFQTT